MVKVKPSTSLTRRLCQSHSSGASARTSSATTLVNGLVFDERKYDLSQVGRFKFNAKLGVDKDLNHRILDVDDFLHLVTYLLRLHRDLGRVDDIDSLANRRVRTVGELMENQFRIGLVRI